MDASRDDAANGAENGAANEVANDVVNDVADDIANDVADDARVIRRLLAGNGVAVTYERAKSLVMAYRALLATDRALGKLGLGGLEPFPPPSPTLTSTHNAPDETLS